MYSFETKIRVRYADTDKMGFAYYGNYPKYYEIARVEAFRSLHCPYKEIEDGGIGMPVLDLSIKYYQPAKYDDLLTVKVIVPEMPRARIRFLYEIKNETGELINSGETTLAFMHLKIKKPVKMPEKLKNAIAPFFN